MRERFAHFLRAAALPCLCGIAACSLFKPNEEPQALVNARIVGMSFGDFTDAFGPAIGRSEQLDGTTAYVWMSRPGAVPNGFVPLDDPVCTLRIFADLRGKIVSASVVLDDPGPTTSSRCSAIFKAK